MRCASAKRTDSRFELPAAVHLTRMPENSAHGAFAGDDDALLTDPLLTSTLKIRRRAVERRYRKEIAMMYENQQIDQ